ncbi:DUF5066 family protein [Klebsiella quasipneumoniae]|uniref:DUF5066 family protein n=1 Tax=Klebsiella quasipneumoniae TaxID=1463165 RepID=UPI00081C0966|nr:DUF5066 family protein [Klebsiella quasipneumoniae]MBU5395406.1 DUF5066 family protein [Klebsiella quasipneumoniae]MBV7687942.1 DUF5066 family protein [Klebsiella quasipneumoniae subsp. similipneumoniae]MCJ7326135.1 DUF5066 family protein [Klebsiella quasipneumoniae]MCY0047291.1 DUF5066 family protein [Klebsiella quasipneumoniae]MDI3084816.1 DUF5066 family protein [Klebsiella quasipneumoniae]
MAFSLPDLMDVVHKHNRNPTPKPMPVEEVDRLRVRKYRDPQNSETVALPESLKALLAYDYQLTSPHGQRVLESVLDAIDEHGVLLSDSLDEDAYYMNGLDMIGLDIEELMPVWNDDPRLPALIRLCHPGDQQVFIYVTERDEQGEYPVVRFEGKENDLWLAESSLIEYLQEIFAGGEESHDEWQHQQALNQARDGALLELEYLHEDLYARLEGCPD